MSNKYSNSHKEKDKDDNSIFSSDLSLLTDKQRTLIESIRKDYLPKVLKDQGLLQEEDIRYKSDLMLNDFERLIHEMDFVLKHHQRIQKMELNLIKLWESYNNDMDSSRKSILYEHLVAFQSYLSAYYFALTDKLKEMNTKYPITT